ncbi:uncharacterized protein AB675_9492 [Cyphellophora attinorum]|uniref:C3H1-type domain-containing protein n=1 Tax=Cyphellophora attinorum TaxID=1664694 RepID=A0A0N1P1I2_9EURO|nr:uncharacterized protein AB675_9492 [Phialophora attinorum]KPI42223.1 hypothetical protein AB675_9492 [Phialophora attinorum]
MEDPIAALQHEYRQIREADDRRHQIFDTLIEQVSTLSKERDDAVRRSQRADMTCDTYQQKLEMAEKRLDSLEKAVTLDQFAVVLIDGDDVLFNDSYIRDGAEGGDRAATDLHNALVEQLRPRGDYRKNIQVRIYLNLAGLAGTYTEAKVIPHPIEFNKFVSGFNRRGLIEIIDAGKVKEAADKQIRENFELFSRNIQCKEIILGFSGDSSHAGFLHDNMPNASTGFHLSLLKGRDFAKDLKPLAENLDVVSAPEIFRDTALPTRTVAAQQAAQASVWSTATQAPPARQPASSSSSDGDATDALIARLTINSPNVTEPPKAAPVPTTSASTSQKTGRKTIFVNSQGQRLDKPLKDVDRDLAKELKQKKLCNRHHLRGDCDKGNTGFFTCNHSHAGTLKEREKQALRFVARTSPCKLGTACQDPDCFYGHRCQYGENCTKTDCWFSDDMHYVALEGIKETLPVEYYTVT